MVVGEVTMRDQLRGPSDPLAPRVETPYGVVRASLLRRVSWGAIIGGTAVAIACQLLLTTLGTGIGLAAIEPATGDDPGSGFAIGAGIWWLITGLISLFAGGWVAGRLAGFPTSVESALHGLLVWSVSAVLGLWLLTTTASTLIGGAFGPLAQGIAQQTAEQAAQGDPNALTRAAEGLSRSAENAANQASQPSQSGGSNTPTSGTQPPGQQQQKQMSEPEARRAADQAADALSAASLWSFFALLLGAAAASFGGMAARPDVNDEDDTTTSIRRMDTPAV